MSSKIGPYQICIGGLELHGQRKTLWQSWYSIGRVWEKGMGYGYTCANMGRLEKKNKRAFQGIESSFSQLKSSLHSLIFFWCMQKVPCCIYRRVIEICRESYRIVNSIFLVYILYMTVGTMFINENKFTW